MSDARQTPEYLVLGKILRPHGVRGEIRMHVLTDYPERLADLEYVYLSEDEAGTSVTTYTLEHVRLHQSYALLTLEGIGDRDQAEPLRQLYVLVDMDNAVPLEEGEFYLYELIGVEVSTIDGEVLGALVDVIETGANDVYVVKSAAYGEVLIPAIDGVIVETDIAARKMTVQLPEGLLPAR
ncbi:MAG: 16S rRNA processing protein RimM [Anaerolineae bacterium]|nr:16S rRNA processing protein RimM [Anaerolineae bacterium]MCA9907776.1 16S rRNA processing protein RimM [Anaerolineae bacterium]